LELCAQQEIRRQKKPSFGCNNSTQLILLKNNCQAKCLLVTIFLTETLPPFSDRFLDNKEYVYFQMERNILPLHRGQEPTLPVSFLPSPSDSTTGAVAVSFRDSPLRLLLLDIKLVCTLLRWLPRFFAPLRTGNRYGELYISSRNIREIFLHVALGIWGSLMLTVSIPLFVAAPVSLFVLYIVMCNTLMFLFCLPLNKGPRTLTSKVDLGNIDARTEERWVFVNGVCAGQYWLQGKQLS
jgi:hypothetical protein